MIRIFHQFPNHSLDNPDVPIQSTTQDPAKKRDPESRCKANEEQRQHGAETSQKENGFAADAVRQTTPEHAADGLCQGKGRDQDSGIKGRVAFTDHVKILHHHPGVG